MGDDVTFQRRLLLAELKPRKSPWRDHDMGMCITHQSDQWPFAGGGGESDGFTLQRSSEAGFWRFLWCWPEQAAEKAELVVYWDVMTLIWHHCNMLQVKYTLRCFVTPIPCKQNDGDLWFVDDGATLSWETSGVSSTHQNSAAHSRRSYLILSYLILSYIARVLYTVRHLLFLSSSILLT